MLLSGVTLAENTEDYTKLGLGYPHFYPQEFLIPFKLSMGRTQVSLNVFEYTLRRVRLRAFQPGGHPGKGFRFCFLLHWSGLRVKGPQGQYADEPTIASRVALFPDLSRTKAVLG